MSLNSNNAVTWTALLLCNALPLSVRPSVRLSVTPGLYSHLVRGRRSGRWLVIVMMPIWRLLLETRLPPLPVYSWNCIFNYLVRPVTESNRLKLRCIHFFRFLWKSWYTNSLRQVCITEAFACLHYTYAKHARRQKQIQWCKQNLAVMNHYFINQEVSYSYGNLLFTTKWHKK